VAEGEAGWTDGRFGLPFWFSLPYGGGGGSPSGCSGGELYTEKELNSVCEWSLVRSVTEGGVGGELGGTGWPSRGGLKICVLGGGGGTLRGNFKGQKGKGGSRREANNYLAEASTNWFSAKGSAFSAGG